MRAQKKMAASIRLGRLLGTGLRTGWIATRGYSNGASMIPLTFGSPYEASDWINCYFSDGVHYLKFSFLFSVSMIM